MIMTEAMRLELELMESILTGTTETDSEKVEIANEILARILK